MTLVNHSSTPMQISSSMGKGVLGAEWELGRNNVQKLEHSVESVGSLLSKDRSTLSTDSSQNSSSWEILGPGPNEKAKELKVTPIKLFQESRDRSTEQEDTQQSIKNLQQNTNAYRMFDKMLIKETGKNSKLGANLCAGPSNKAHKTANTHEGVVNSSNSGRENGDRSSFWHIYFKGGTNRIPKTIFPIFEGSESMNWDRNCVDYFTISGIKENQKVRLVAIYANRRVVVYFCCKNLDVSWKELSVDVCVRFREDENCL